MKPLFTRKGLMNFQKLLFVFTHINQKYRTLREYLYETQNEISFCHEKNLFTLVFITGEMK